jgi:hypothetical protein
METSTVKIDEKRINFKTLLLKNPNYFGNITKSDLKSIFKMVANVTYEELTCIGFTPQQTS